MHEYEVSGLPTETVNKCRAIVYQVLLISSVVRMFEYNAAGFQLLEVDRKNERTRKGSNLSELTSGPEE